MLPKILVFDSGLGGLTVFGELRKLRDGDYLYIADDAAFPYGRLSEEVVGARVEGVIERALRDFAADMVVIACNTASTLVMPRLRARWPDLPFVGTVPAIKPAAALTASGMFSVLATPGTVARDYTHELVRQFAGGCDVALVGSKRLASLAEAFMQGEALDEAEIWAELAPCFVAHEARRTDVIVLACTHYPLLLEQFQRLAPWPVQWIDPGPAIARRADHVLRDLALEGQESLDLVGKGRGRCAFAFTSGREPGAALWSALQRYGFDGVSDCALVFEDRGM